MINRREREREREREIGPKSIIRDHPSSSSSVALYFFLLF
jgi:hypothetical protein